MEECISTTACECLSYNHLEQINLFHYCIANLLMHHDKDKNRNLPPNPVAIIHIAFPFPLPIVFIPNVAIPTSLSFLSLVLLDEI